MQHRFPALLLCATLGAYGLAGCEDPSMANDDANVQHDDDRFPGNDGGQETPDNPAEGTAGAEVGGIESYGDQNGEVDAEYEAVFGGPEGDEKAAVFDGDGPVDGVDPLNVPATGVQSGEGGARYNRGDESPEGAALGVDADNADNPRENFPDRSKINTEGGTSRVVPGEAYDERRELGERIDQSEVGAVGYDNEELDDYYDGPEDYDGGDGATYSGESPEFAIGDGGADVEGAYEVVQAKLRPVPENQQAMLYVPTRYSYTLVSGWDGGVLAATATDIDGETGTGEVAYDRPPAMGSGCEQADDPVTCSTANLSKGLSPFLNRPAVLRDLQAAGVSDVDFEVDKDGKVMPGSLVVYSDAGVCTDARCRRLGRALERQLGGQAWSPAQRQGVATASRVDVPLYYSSEPVTDEGVEL